MSGPDWRALAAKCAQGAGVVAICDTGVVLGWSFVELFTDDEADALLALSGRATCSRTVQPGQGQDEVPACEAYTSEGLAVVGSCDGCEGNGTRMLP